MTDVFGSNYASMLGNINGIVDRRTRRQAGQQYAAGNTKGAVSTLYGGGDFATGAALDQITTTQNEAERKRQAESGLRVATTLRDVGERGGNVVQAMDSLKGQILATGVDEDQFMQMRAALEADPRFINEIARLAGAEADKYKIQDLNGDLIATNERTLGVRTLIDNPDMPFVRDGMLFTPPSGGSAAGSPGQPAPLTGAAIGSGPLFTPGAVPIDSPPPAAPKMLAITAQSESGSRERDPRTGALITSPEGAQGMMQVMPTTNTDPGYGVTPARDNSDAERTRVGGDYLAAMMREYGNDPAKAWAAYNWGPGNLDRAIAQHGGDWLNYAPAETRDYVAKNLRALNGGEVAQGDQDALPSGAQTLSGGWTMTPIETPAMRAAAEQREYQRQRDATQDARAERTESRAAASADRTETREERVARDQLYQRFTANKDVQRYVETDSAYRDIKALASSNSGVNDVALTFGIMRMVQADGSVVREGEFALLGAAAGIPELVIRLVQRARNGESLTPEQRRQVVAAADTLHRTRQEKHNEIASQFRGYAEQDGFDPDRVARLAGGESRRDRRAAGRMATPEQDAFYATLPGGGRTGKLGTFNRPYTINIDTERQSLGNINPGEWFVTPGGERLLMPNPNPYRRAR